MFKLKLRNLDPNLKLQLQRLETQKRAALDSEAVYISKHAVSITYHNV